MISFIAPRLACPILTLRHGNRAKARRWERVNLTNVCYLTGSEKGQKTPTLKLISAVAADSWQPDKKSLKARKHDMWRKQAVDRGRVWLRLLIKDHPPSFCLFFSLLTSLKASWTSGQQRSSFFLVGCAVASFGGIDASGLIHSTGGGEICPLFS